METIEPARELCFDCYKHLRVTEYKLPPNAKAISVEDVSRQNSIC